MLAKRVEVIEESTEPEYEDDDSDVADNETKLDHGQDEDAYSAVEKINFYYCGIGLQNLHDMLRFT